jgi:hypothetical protein
MNSNICLIALCTLLLFSAAYGINISFRPEKGVNLVEKKKTKPGDLFLDWKECYGEPTSPYITPHFAQLKFVGTAYNTPGVAVSIQASLTNNFTISPNEVFYKFELWHEQTGARIKYKGPYDVCCGGFVLPNHLGKENVVTQDIDIYNWQRNRTVVECDTQQEQLCPPTTGIFDIYVMRPLHREDRGTYEASLTLYRNKDIKGEEDARSYIEPEELMCIDIQFKYDGEKCEEGEQCWSPHTSSGSNVKQESSTNIITVDEKDKKLPALVREELDVQI